MDCREFLHRYSEYDDSLIPPREADRFRDHMAECPSCARYDRVLRKGRMLARQLPEVEPRPDFIPRLRLRLRQLRSRRRTASGAGLATGLAAATILLVALTAVRFMGPAPGGVADVDMVALSGPAPGSTAGSTAGSPAGAPAVGRTTTPSLPTTGRAAPRRWTATVAPAGAASYSPLEVGPPAYRGAPPTFRGPTDSDRRALD